MRSHEQFCAEIASRKSNIIKKRRMRQRVLFACVPFILSFGILTTALLHGGLFTETSPEEEFFPLDALEHLDSLTITLPSANLTASGEKAAELSVTVPSNAEALLAFIEAYEEAFLFSDGEDGWYAFYTVTFESGETAKDNLPETFDAAETVNEAETEMAQEEWTDASLSIGTEEEEWNPLPEGTLREGEETYLPETGKAEGTAGATAEVTMDRAETTVTVESILSEEALATEVVEEVCSDYREDADSVNGETSLPYIPPTVQTSKYQFSSVELYNSVVNMENVYIISIKTTDGETVHYALDATRYKDLAEQLQTLLDGFEN